MKMLQITYLVQFFSFFKKPIFFGVRNFTAAPLKALKPYMSEGGGKWGGISPPQHPFLI